MTIKLEYGKKYVMRDGTVTDPLEVDDSRDVYPFRCPSNSISFSPEGYWLSQAVPREFDLVAEYVEPELDTTAAEVRCFSAAAEVKPSNPKDSIGVTKPPLSCVPCGPLFEVGAAMLDGSCKYGRHNYREIGVRASVYYDAMLRHAMKWWEGEDKDKDSGCLHLAHLAACAIILMDCPDVTDDRPPIVGNPVDRVADLVKQILAKYPEPKVPFVEKKS